MRYLLTILILIAIGTLVLFSCAKYKDSKATADPRLTNPYCNDPNAVNYNWGFPGKPDNSVCFYPTDIFKGVYQYHDSIFLTSTGLFVRADTLTLMITKVNSTKFTIAGFCPSGATLSLTAGANYTATLDTAIGDTTTAIRGQQLCGVADTVNGTLTKDRLNDSVMYINFLVASDTGVYTSHVGQALLKSK
jgi:hypothetical protein